MEADKIEECERGIIQHIEEIMECFIGVNAVDVDSGPGDWDGSYLKNLLPRILTKPTIRVVFEGGGANDSTELTLETAWSVVVHIGISATTQETRRYGSRGAYRLCALLASQLHNEMITFTPGVGQEPEEMGQAKVDSIENLWDGAKDRVHIAVYNVGLLVSLPIDSDIPPAKPLDDFLRVGAEFDTNDDDVAEASEVANVRGGP